MPEPFHYRVIQIIKQIPAGKIATYGQIAALAGSPRAARQITWILHSSSKKENLPWHRIINNRGSISLPRGSGFELQKKLLENEDIVVLENGLVDLDRYLWKPDLRSIQHTL